MFMINYLNQRKRDRKNGNSKKENRVYFYNIFEVCIYFWLEKLDMQNM